MTPRQAWLMWAALTALTSSTRGDGERVPVAPEGVPDTGPRKTGVQGVAGLGMADYDCWSPAPHTGCEGKGCEACEGSGIWENDLDPFSVDREIVRQRAEVFLMKLCKEGQAVHLGIPQNNFDAANMVMHRGWRENCERFDAITRLFEQGDLDGWLALAKQGQLTTFQVLKGDLDRARRMWEFTRARYPGRFAESRKETDHGIQQQAQPQEAKRRRYAPGN